MAKKVNPSVIVKVVVIKKDGSSYPWFKEPLEGHGALETHRDYLTRPLAGYVFKELKEAVYAVGASAVKVDINNKQYSSRRYMAKSAKLVTDIYDAIVKEIGEGDLEDD